MFGAGCFRVATGSVWEASPLASTLGAVGWIARRRIASESSSDLLHAHTGLIPTQDKVMSFTFRVSRDPLQVRSCERTVIPVRRDFLFPYLIMMCGAGVSDPYRSNGKKRKIHFPDWACRPFYPWCNQQARGYVRNARCTKKHNKK